mmetsp:Transcript_49478/g.120105  ORF Transcript_49478/g.120105 Transcript_49478/m.120105 type:complete len:759 (-) Transcript_49478:186-2462(-)
MTKTSQFPTVTTMVQRCLFLISLMILTGGDFVKTSSASASSVFVGTTTASETEILPPPGGTKYPHFIAMNETMTCIGDTHSTPFNNAVRGVNLGGWMVLEPWITPSLFYQFLGQPEGKVGIDSYTFCEVLGGKEANRQLKRHWETWVTEGIIRQLKESGAVNSLRLPIGDFQFIPYGPYLDGCWDGSLEYVDRVLDWAWSNGLTVLLDIHALKDSQNGFDNSGQARGFQWTTAIGYEYASDHTFQHWPIRTAEWMGKFNYANASYPDINYGNIQHALDVIQIIVDRYKGHPAVLGLEPVNEPWQFTPIDELKKFYWEGYLIVKRDAPYWKYIMHDSFRLDPKIWGGFMAGCPERAIDTHIYQAWRDPDSRIGYYKDACDQKVKIADMEREFGPIVVGEWSLATDNCAMWLNGFNDNLPGFPRLPCKLVPCADPYMGPEQPGTPVDPQKPHQGPFGTGMSSPSFGYCPVDREWAKESSGNPQTGRDWVNAPPDLPHHLDDTDNVMWHLAHKKINAFSGIGHGFYFWNFRTDLEEPTWSYLGALARGWIPTGNLHDDSVIDACVNEDSVAFKCIIKRDVKEDSLRAAVKWINGQNNATENSKLDELSGSELRSEAESSIDGYYQANKFDGVNCDFGGIGLLVGENRTITDDDFLGWNDDEYYVYVYSGPSWWLITLYIVLGTLVGSVVGFMAAMRFNRSFNKRVRESKFFRTHSFTQNPLVRKSLSIGNFAGDLNDLDNLYKEDEKASLSKTGRQHKSYA